MPLLPGPLCPGVIVLDRVPSMDQIDQFEIIRIRLEYSKPTQIKQNFKEGVLFALSGKPLKLTGKLPYPNSNEFTKNNINIRLAKVWTVIDRLSLTWKSDLSAKIKSDFFQAVTVSILQYGCIK